MNVWTDMPHDAVTRQRHRWGARAWAALLLTLALLPQGFAATIRANFDHLTTGFELIGQHRDLPCESCHANAMFKGTPSDCGACHGIGTTVRATAKPANHILSTDRCASCHTPVAWNPAVNFDHTQVRGTCSTCHNGVMAQGKGPTHIVTDLECDACHTTLTWAGAFFTHLGVTSNCASCHNGVSATGMPATHIPVGTPPTPCEGCHSTTNFTTWAGTLINHLAVTALTCASCHETGNYLGMHPSTNTAAGDSRPPTALDPNHPPQSAGDCGVCHDTTTFGSSALRPANHIPTSAPCSQCHTTPGNYKAYSVTGTHQGVTGCLSCHGSTVAATFANIVIVTTPSNHIPIGSLDCNGSGCHTTTNVNAGGFKLGMASLSSPTLSLAGHSTVAGTACMSCHETAPYIGMLASTSTTAGDSRPTALDKSHPTGGDCSGCHTTAPTFATNQTGNALPAKHIPTTAPCAQCHTTAGNYAMYSSPGTHQGVSGCLSCHGSTVNTTFLNITMVTTPGNHIPIGTLDCNGSGCHSTGNVNPGGGGFILGTASISSPTLTVAGHTTVAAVGACTTCHESAPYIGMLASSATTAGDSRPTALDKLHPTSGDCATCHTTAPTFLSDVTAGGKPTNHIPTTAPCAQCHTTAGNYAMYSSPGTHQGVTGCLSCHGPTVNTTFVNVTMVTTPANHIPIGTLDCNGSGCHTTTNVNAGGFKLGTASITNPTLNAAGHVTVAAAGACATCHESASYLGMTPSTALPGGDSRPGAYDAVHPKSGDCGNCHVTTPTFGTNLLPTAPKPSNHIPTTAVCAQCHTTAGNYALYSVTGTHQGVSGCLTCHGPTVNTTFVNVTMVTTPANHMPIGTLDCNGSGCHTTTNVNAGGFQLGNANINNPTLTVAGHTTVAAAVTGCMTCHETAPYVGMLASSATAAGDSRPTALDKIHPTSGDCNGCHTTTPTFSSDQTGSAKPANHIPTNAPCAQCHTTVGNNALYSVTGTHQGVSGCLTCHGSTVNTTFANITIVTNPGNHIPFGSLDCNGSGCHTTSNVNAGGFKLGAASIASPTLTVAGHNTVAAAVTGCTTCHESAPYVGMLASSATTAGDSRPTAFDKAHPTSGDCNGCHTTTPTFTTNQTGGSKPSNHIPTTAACAQCHTTAGNYAAYSVTGTHQGVTGCLTCHGSTVAGTFANITIVSTPSNHFPIGSLDCNGSGCHSTSNVNPGGFKVGAASLTAPTLTVAGHATVASPVPGCMTCHETSPFVGMLASTATAAGDSRPQAFDKAHPASGDCNGCHSTTPTFTTNQMGSAAKPANHIPTNAACGVCHTTPGNLGLYVMGVAGHAGITNNCKQCHAYGLSFYNMAPPTLVEPAAGATGHIPAVPPNGTGTLDCVLCHTVAATSFATFSGTVMKHAYVTSMTCMSCHELGMQWKTNGGLWKRPGAGHYAGRDCGGSGCHSARDKRAIRPAATVSTATTKPGTGGTARAGAGPRGGTAAPALGQPAPATAGAAPAVPFNHATIGATACVTCHTAASGSGKPATHIATSNSCQSCHTTLAWLPVRAVDHTQVTGTCVSCHNGVVATGKRSSHVPTSAGCESCHTTNAWMPARFDHLGVAAHTCTTCHNSVRAVGMARMHIPTTQQCDVCHGTLAWKPARVDHSTFTSGCASCHNNGGATGLSPGHMSTRLDCATCHSYPDWSINHFRHTSVAYPGTHRTALSCTSCHTSNTDQVPYSAPANAGTCGGCHAKDFKPAAHPKTVKGLNYTASELANCSGACHVYSDTTQSTITRSLPGPHHRVSDATFKH
jgi:hypothetical protein